MIIFNLSGKDYRKLCEAPTSGMLHLPTEITFCSLPDTPTLLDMLIDAASMLSTVPVNPI